MTFWKIFKFSMKITKAEKQTCVALRNNPSNLETANFLKHQPRPLHWITNMEKLMPTVPPAPSSHVNLYEICIAPIASAGQMLVYVLLGAWVAFPPKQTRSDGFPYRVRLTRSPQSLARFYFNSRWIESISLFETVLRKINRAAVAALGWDILWNLACAEY